MPISKLNARFKNSSMAVKLTTVSFGIYILFSLVVTPIVAKVNLSQDVEFFLRAAAQARTGAIGFLQNRDVSGACEFLSKGYEADLFSFYVLQANGALLCAEPQKAIPDIDLPYKEFGKLYRSSDLDYSFQSEKSGNFIITTGSINDSNAKLWQYLKALSGRLLIAPAIILFIFALIFSLASIPWRKLTARLRNEPHDASQGQFLQSLVHSKENTLIEAATEAFYLENKNLKEKVNFIADDFSHALRKEMQQRRAEFPYFFSGTVLRFDLNDYTKLYFETDKVFINHIIRTIAVQVDEIVNRYNGVHYSFGGDEFVQIFKNPHYSILSAMACMRDIFNIIPNLNLSPEMKEKIKFKASLSFDGKILFAELPQCDSLTSNALILTNRYFSAAGEKNVNSLLLGQSEIEEASQLATFEARKPFQLKNIQGEQLISRANTFRSLKDVLQSRDFNLIPFFRSDSDIIGLFQFIREPSTSLNDKMEIVSKLKEIKVSICSDQLLTEWLSTIRAFDQNWQGHERLLASLIILGKNLIPQEKWTAEVTAALVNLQVNADGRANSDIIEVASEKISQAEFDTLEDKLVTPKTGFSCRAQGNIILAKSQHGLSQELVQDIQELLSSKNANQLATGIFCASRVIQKYRQENPVVLSQYLEFSDFQKMISRHTTHPDSMVRSRATLESRALTQRSPA